MPVMAQKWRKILKIVDKWMNLYDQVKDVEFMIMGIGDMACDKRPLHDKMTAEQQSVKTVFNDWDMMGARWSEFGVDNPRVEVTAGSCTQGAEPPSGKDSEGSPTVTCRLDFTNDAGGAPDKTMGLFYLQRNEDGSWTIVGYLRQYM